MSVVIHVKTHAQSVTRTHPSPNPYFTVFYVKWCAQLLLLSWNTHHPLNTHAKYTLTRPLIPAHPTTHSYTTNTHITTHSRTPPTHHLYTHSDTYAHTQTLVDDDSHLKKDLKPPKRQRDLEQIAKVYLRENNINVSINFVHRSLLLSTHLAHCAGSCCN